MRTKFVTALASILMLLGSVALRAEDKLHIIGPAKVSPGDLIVLDAGESRIFDAAPQKYVWKLINSDKSFMPMEGGSKVVFATGTPGKYRFLLIAVGISTPKDAETKVIVLDKEVTVTVEGSDPKPPGPEPDPGPRPGPGPGPTDKLTVVVLKSFDQSIPQEQQSIITGKKVEEYLNTVAPIRGADSGYRFLDPRTPTTGEATFIQKALAQPRDSLPWVVIQGPKGSYSGPLPANEDSFITLVEKYK